MDLILLLILSYAIYRMAISYNITPWKWIIRYVGAFIASGIAVCAVIINIDGANLSKDISELVARVYGESLTKDLTELEKIGLALQPFILLYQIMLFFFFRTRIMRYVHNLDLLEKNNDNNIPNPPSTLKKDQKDQKDFSYFR